MCKGPEVRELGMFRPLKEIQCGCMGKGKAQTGRTNVCPVKEFDCFLR